MILSFFVKLSCWCFSWGIPTWALMVDGWWLITPPNLRRVKMHVPKKDPIRPKDGWNQSYTVKLWNPYPISIILQEFNSCPFRLLFNSFLQSMFEILCKVDNWFAMFCLLNKVKTLVTLVYLLLILFQMIDGLVDMVFQMFFGCVPACAGSQSNCNVNIGLPSRQPHLDNLKKSHLFVRSLTKVVQVWQLFSGFSNFRHHWNIHHYEIWLFLGAPDFKENQVLRLSGITGDHGLPRKWPRVVAWMRRLTTPKPLPSRFVSWRIVWTRPGQLVVFPSGGIWRMVSILSISK